MAQLPFSNQTGSPEDLAQVQAQLPLSAGLAERVIADDAQLTGRLTGALAAQRQDRPDLYYREQRAAPGSAGSFSENPFEETLDVSGLPRGRVMDADEANERFGIDGHLNFSDPVGEGQAAYLQSQAQSRLFRDEVLSRSDINPLQALGAGLFGGLTDPVGVPLIFLPEALGVRGAVEGGLAARAGSVVFRAGRVGNAARGAVAGAAEGLLGGAIYEAGNYGLRRYAGEDDYTLAQSSMNVLLGGVLGGGFGALGGMLSRAGREGGVEGEAAASAPEPRLPRGVEALDANSRLGAMALSIEDVIEDRPVRAGALVLAQVDRAPPKAPEVGDLWRLSPDELDGLLREASEDDAAKLLRAFDGDEAEVAEFKRLDRMQNSWDPQRSDEGARLFDARYGNLTPKQEQLIYGVGEIGPQADDIKAILTVHGDIAAQDPDDWLAYMAATSARGVSVEDLAKVPRGEGSVRAQAAFVRLQLARQEMLARGVSGNDLPRQMVDALVNRAGWDAGDAAEIIGRFFSDMVEAARKAADDVSPASQVLDRLNDRMARGAESEEPLFREAQTRKAIAAPARPAPKVKPDGAAAPSTTPEARSPSPTRGEELISGDEELAALASDTEALIAAAGVEVPSLPADDPNIIAEAIRAAAFCLKEGG